MGGVGGGREEHCLCVYLLSAGMRGVGMRVMRGDITKVLLYLVFLVTGGG